MSAGECMYNGGKDDRGDWSSDGSQWPQMKVGGVSLLSQIWNIIRKGKGGVDDNNQILRSTGKVSKKEIYQSTKEDQA